MTETTDYKALYHAQRQTHEQLQQSHAALEHKVLDLQYQLQQLAKFLNGFKSERFVPASTDESQKELGLVFDVAAAVHTQAAQEITYIKANRQTAINAPRQNDGQIPQHIRRETTVLEPAEEVGGYEKDGEEITETLSWKPGEIFVNRIVRPRYRTKDQSGKERIIIAALPQRAIAKCQADPALLAQVVIDKFVDHKPLNRQLDCFKRSNIIIPYSTIADWVRLVATILQPCVCNQELTMQNFWQSGIQNNWQQ